MRKHKPTSLASRAGVVHQAGPLTIREKHETEGAYRWTTYLVQGWQENGVWQRRKFKDFQKARDFVALQAVKLMNRETALNSVITVLSQDQVKQAETAFRRLQGRYSLDQVVDYFVKNHVDPEKPKDLADAMAEFNTFNETSLKPRTQRALKGTLQRFKTHLTESKGSEKIPVHEITAMDVAAYLGKLSTKNGKAVKRKTYNNNRLEISSFFSWALSPAQRYAVENPVTEVPHFANEQIDEQRDVIAILAPEDARKLFVFLESFKSGSYCKYYALACFAGLRPESEILRLHEHPGQNELIDLDHYEIELPKSLTPKSSSGRTVTIQPNLAAWLKAYPGPLLPEKNVIRDLEFIRKKMQLTQDICRHSWFTYTIGRDGSISNAALEGGNSEKIVKKHYFKVGRRRKELAAGYWSIVPQKA